MPDFLSQILTHTRVCYIDAGESYQETTQRILFIRRQNREAKRLIGKSADNFKKETLCMIEKWNKIPERVLRQKSRAT